MKRPIQNWYLSRELNVNNMETTLTIGGCMYMDVYIYNAKHIKYIIINSFIIFSYRIDLCYTHTEHKNWYHLIRHNVSLYEQSIVNNLIKCKFWFSYLHAHYGVIKSAKNFRPPKKCILIKTAKRNRGKNGFMYGKVGIGIRYIFIYLTNLCLKNLHFFLLLHCTV